MIEANNPDLKSWVEVPANSDFPIQNLPFGIFSINNASPRAGVAIGNFVIDLSVLSELGFFDSLELTDTTVFHQHELNSFIALGKPVWTAVRNRISELLRDDNSELRDNGDAKRQVLYPMQMVQMHLPVHIGDYTDFYSSIEHATNVGTMFRGKENALPPNWLHLPIGYHGRSSSIVVSGTPVHRPKGQTKADDDAMPTYQPSRLLDFELEMGFIVGKSTQLGESISTKKAEEHIFGMVLFNDWSARDIQKWEYVPLGPFLGKSFASTISPWIVTMDALDPFRVESPQQDPEVLPYLQYEGKKNYDINLAVTIKPENSEEKVVCQSNFKHLYWNMSQQLAHHTVNGCNINVGDMYASGTISGKSETAYGSMLELTWRGSKPIAMPDGSERKFINDNDTVIVTGYCEKEGFTRIGFGDASGKVFPAV